MSKYFYSCDWGTTNLRLRLVDASAATIISGIETDHGIAKSFSEWKGSGEDRLQFYSRILQNCISKLKAIDTPSTRIPVIVSGMASSNIGMIELPYAELPVSVDGTGLKFQSFERSGDFDHPLIVISGVKTNNDFMRGEEVQVIGACQSRLDNDGLFILPGTHSKHVWVHNNNITDLKTYMTGELFQLLTANSILSTSIELSDEFVPGWEKFFEEGVMQSLKGDALEHLFGLRVAYVFNRRTPQQSQYYLTGLLIGSELKNIRNYEREVVLVSNERQKKYYTIAFDLLDVGVSRNWISSETATVCGHKAVVKKHLKGNL